ncbi:MAG: TIGR02391 family protein [Gemmatimonadaceae bacterium]|nr:TIGR02391 family protein [Gemmatimonadaceae bacterium]
MATKPPPFSAGELESLCKILADTTHGLTGSEIESFLTQAKIKDVEPGITKWKRLYNALATRQNRDGNADRVFGFIRLGLDPARYVGQHAVFEDRRTAINAVLALCGFEYRPDGKFVIVEAASTLSEAEARAHRLRAALSSRGVHPDVIAACRVELVQHNAFHAVLEASKSVGEKLRRRTGLQSDGAQLTDEALGGDSPRLKINGFTSDSEKSEQRGFTNLMKGLFGVFRNPTAHTPRTEWNMTEEDALDLFSIASYVHRRIDRAI